MWNGTELKALSSSNTATLNFHLDAHGYGAVLETQQLTGPQAEILKRMHEQALHPLATFSKEWTFLPQELLQPSAHTKPLAAAPTGMVQIPGGNYRFKVSGSEIEGDNDVGVDVQMPWEPSPRRHHEHTMQMKSFYIDQFLVTNADFKHFLEETHYHPKDDHNFLKDWKDGSYPQGWK